MVPNSRFLLSPGIYRLQDGNIFRARLNRSKNNIYTEKWTRQGDRFSFVYEPKAIATLSMDLRLPLEDARAISREAGQCLACAAILTDKKSQLAGIGPTCEKTWTKAEAIRILVRIEPCFSEIEF